jgi:hypothetical protein
MVPPQVRQRPGWAGGLATVVDRPHEKQYSRKRFSAPRRSVSRCSAGKSGTSGTSPVPRARLAQRAQRVARTDLGPPQCAHVGARLGAGNSTGPPSSIIRSVATASAPPPSSSPTWIGMAGMATRNARPCLRTARRRTRRAGRLANMNLTVPVGRGPVLAQPRQVAGQSRPGGPAWPMTGFPGPAAQPRRAAGGRDAPPARAPARWPAFSTTRAIGIPCCRAGSRSRPSSRRAYRRVARTAPGLLARSQST